MALLWRRLSCCGYLAHLVTFGDMFEIKQADSNIWRGNDLTIQGLSLISCKNEWLGGKFKK